LESNFRGAKEFLVFGIVTKYWVRQDGSIYSGDMGIGDRAATPAEVAKEEARINKLTTNAAIFTKIEEEEKKQLRAERELRTANTDATKKAAAARLLEIDNAITQLRQGIIK
jgi:hypothetical protein